MNYLYSTTILFSTLVLSRLIGLPENFTPLLALAVFTPRLGTSVWLPVAVLAVTDLVLGMYTVMPVVYACMLLAAYLGSRIQNVYWAGASSILVWHVLVNGAVVIAGPGFPPFSAEALMFDARLFAGTMMFIALFDYLRSEVFKVADVFETARKAG